ncbi:MAG: amylo-alpha-1,6-glucosidase, partial [Vulcanimicrobiota bacterium]
RTTIKDHTFTTPSKVIESDSHLDYEGKQWLWDSAFHGMILAKREPDVAKEELRSLMANQHEDGFVPHMNYFRGDAQKVPGWAKRHFENFLKTPEGADIPKSEHEAFVNTYWSYPDHSDITQPPVVGMSVEEVYKQTGDKKFVREMLPGLKKYYDYLHDKRDPDNDNLISIIHPWESGWDNSQRWDETIGVTDGDRHHIDDKKMNLFANYKKVGWDLDKVFEMDKFNVEPVDFNVLYARNMEAVSRLCGEVGDKEGEKLYAQRANDTKQAIFEKMWDGDKYVDLTGSDEKKSDVKSAAMFYPMMLDGEKHGKQLIERHLMNPNEFNIDYGVPTTSQDHKLFDGGQYWRGNVWQNVNVFVWEGLQKVLSDNPGYKPAEMMSDKIKDSSFELLDKAGFSEYFDPVKGEGHGVKTFGWNGMVRFMEPEYE